MKLRPRDLLLIYLLIGCIAALQQHLSGLGNNYHIFQHSFEHLLDGENLYVHYPDQHSDLFKYSPTFALIMGLFSWMPIGLGMSLFGILSALVLYWGVIRLPIERRYHIWILLLLLPDMFVDLQNNQTNSLTAGCMLLAFSAVWRGRVWPFALAISAAFLVKIYGMAVAVVALLKRQWWRFALASLAVFAGFILLPVVVTGFQGLLWQYENWKELLLWDDGAHYGISAMGILHTWFGWEGSNRPIQLVGLLLTLLPLIRLGLHKNLNWVLRYLATVLLFVVVFNHKAESPTFIIASTGVALWFVAGNMRSYWRIALLVFSLILTGLTPTDVFPLEVRKEWIEPYNLKVLGTLVLFFVVQVELWLPRKHYIDYGTRE